MIIIIAKIIILACTSIAAVYSMVRIFRGKIIATIPAQYGSYEIEIQKTGFYSLWFKSQLFRKNELGHYHAQLFKSSGQKQFTFPSLIRPSINGFKSGKMQLKYYYLKTGTYYLQISQEQEAKLNIIDKIVNKIIPDSNNKSLEAFEIKNTFPEFIFILSIFGCLFPIGGILLLALGKI